jgi:glycopeptide antibiotics resistance protein
MGLISIYIQSMIGYTIFVLPFYVFGRMFFLKKRQKQIIVRNEMLLLFFVLYIAGLASQTIIPQWYMGIVSDTGEFYFIINLSNEISKVNLIPFNTLYQYFYEANTRVADWNDVSILNITANLLLFSPIGFFVPLIWTKCNSLKKVTSIGLTVTIFIELIQLFIGRSTDIDDVILNSLGIMMGYMVLLFCLILVKPFINKQLNKEFVKSDT